MTALILKSSNNTGPESHPQSERPIRNLHLRSSLKHRLCGPLTEEFSDLLKTASMRPDKIHQILNKFPPFHLLMHIDTSGLRNQKNRIGLPSAVTRTSPNVSVICAPKPFRRTFISSAVSSLPKSGSAWTPDNKAVSLPAGIPASPAAPSPDRSDSLPVCEIPSCPILLLLRLHIEYIRNITEQLANLKMLRTYLLALSALDTIRRFSVVSCMDPIIDI